MVRTMNRLVRRGGMGPRTPHPGAHHAPSTRGAQRSRILSRGRAGRAPRARRLPIPQPPPSTSFTHEELYLRIQRSERTLTLLTQQVSFDVLRLILNIISKYSSNILNFLERCVSLLTPMAPSPLSPSTRLRKRSRNTGGCSTTVSPS